MPTDPTGDGPLTKRFEVMARDIIYRWSVERDTWVSGDEIREARAYLQERGIVTTNLPDGRFSVQGETAAILETAQLILLSVRHVVDARRRLLGFPRKPAGQ